MEEERKNWFGEWNRKKKGMAQFMLEKNLKYYFNNHNNNKNSIMDENK